MNKLSLFIFRRDLRLADNTGLMKALSESEKVIPLFIFTPMQVSNKNKYKSSNAIQFMIESLFDLDYQINKINVKCRLWIGYGDEIKIINKIHSSINVNAIYINEDYTPYAIKRDNSIKKYCMDHQISFSVSTDVLLLDINTMTASNGNHYHNFTLFYNKALNYEIRKPKYVQKNNYKSFTADFKQWNIKNADKFLLDHNYYQINLNIAIIGGRKAATKILHNIQKFKNYKKIKQFPACDTTKLSAYLKFGCISVREAYVAFQIEKSGELVRGLYWRDFYYYVSIHFKQFYRYEHIMADYPSDTKWDNNRKYFNAWKNAKTGFPLIDAAMNEMNITGFMHNRGRLAVSSFLVKDLLIDWKYGERYFSTKLVDIDRAQNVGNWNWSSSFGLDNTPFLRIFNPWTQSKTYDPDCEYIKKWIPELINVENKHIHRWDKYHNLYKNIDYPDPIINHDVQRKKFIKFYKQITKKN